MRVHLVNPSDTSFGTAVITPRWLYVLAAATPASFGAPRICDETLERLDPADVQAGDVVGIGIHTSNALRGYEIGRMLRERGACVQTVRGCAKHCSFCSVWRTDGQRPRQRPSDPVVEEIVALRRLGFRFIALADDNFYPVSLTDIELAERQGSQHRVDELQSIRNDRFELMERLAELPKDMVFYSQITMEAARPDAPSTQTC